MFQYLVAAELRTNQKPCMSWRSASYSLVRTASLSFVKNGVDIDVEIRLLYVLGARTSGAELVLGQQASEQRLAGFRLTG